MSGVIFRCRKKPSYDELLRASGISSGKMKAALWDDIGKQKSVVEWMAPVDNLHSVQGPSNSLAFMLGIASVYPKALPRIPNFIKISPSTLHEP